MKKIKVKKKFKVFLSSEVEKSGNVGGSSKFLFFYHIFLVVWDTVLIV